MKNQKKLTKTIFTRELLKIQNFSGKGKPKPVLVPTFESNFE
jgi:hypothetical protein